MQRLAVITPSRFDDPTVGMYSESGLQLRFSEVQLTDSTISTSSDNSDNSEIVEEASLRCSRLFAAVVFQDPKSGVLSYPILLIAGWRHAAMSTLKHARLDAYRGSYGEQSLVDH